MQIIEKILSIPEFPDYLIYPNGDVYSKRRNLILKPRYDKDGYKRLSLKNIFTKKLETVKIHHLVSKCYLGYTKDCGLVVDHINNDKNNNYLHNLQIITQEQKRKNSENQEKSNEKNILKNIVLKQDYLFTFIKIKMGIVLNLDKITKKKI